MDTARLAGILDFLQAAERLKTTKPPQGLTVNPFEVFIAAVEKT